MNNHDVDSGHSWNWRLRDDALTRSVPHEQTEPLPRSVAARVRDAFEPRCGRPRNGTDKPCRASVLLPGDACAWHVGIPTAWGAR